MRRRVDVHNLRPGMFVTDLDRPWLGTPFLLEGVLIKTDREIRVLQRLCKHVYIDTDQGWEIPTSPLSSDSHPPRKVQIRAKHVAHPGNSSPLIEDSQTLSRIHFAEEISRAKVIHQQTETLIDTMHDDVRHGRRIDTKGSQALVSDILQSVVRDADAVLWITHLKDRDRYTALHSMNVCVLLLVFGHYLGLEKDSLQELGLAGLLHDIGKVRVPLEVLNKPDKLTDGEFDLIKRHPLHGLSILLDAGALPRKVLNVAHCHHERIVGGGYPRGLQGKAINFFSRLTSIVDVYDALTSDRAYRKGMSSPDAFKLMNKWRGQHLDGMLLDKFAQCIGDFPSGSLVELQSGEVGIIIPSGRNNRLKPIIMLLLDPFKRKYYPLRIVDYAIVDKSRNSKLHIRRVLPKGKYGINPIDYAADISAEFKK